MAQASDTFPIQQELHRGLVSHRGADAPPRRVATLHSRTVFGCRYAGAEYMTVLVCGWMVLRLPPLQHLSHLSAGAAFGVALVGAACVSATIVMLGGYDVGRLARPDATIEELFASGLAGGAGSFAALILVHAARIGVSALVWSLVCVAVLSVARAITGSVVRRRFAAGGLLYRIVTIGSGPDIRDLRAALTARRDAGIVVHEVATDDTAPNAWRNPVPGAAIDAVVLEHDQPGCDFDREGAAPAEIFLAGQTGPDVLPPRHPLQGLQLKLQRGAALSQTDMILKTMFDRVLSAMILITILPVLALIACAIKLDSPGPVLFRQPRIGFNNRVFFMLKFRTMYHHDRDLLATRQTERNDARITRLGRLLRRLSADELPQLINVLRGEMSLVGPRPHAPQTAVNGRALPELLTHYRSRHRVQPGITGWAQVNGSRGALCSELELQQRVALDLDYIANWSLFLDLKILALTVLRELFSETAC